MTFIIIIVPINICQHIPIMKIVFQNKRGPTMVIRANMHNRLCTSVIKCIENDPTTDTNGTVAFIMIFFKFDNLSEL